MKNLNKSIKGIGVFLLYILVPMLLPSITSSNTKDLYINIGIMFLLLLLFIFAYKEDIIKDIKAFNAHFFKNICKSLAYSAILIVGLLIVSIILVEVFHVTYNNSSLIDSLLHKNIFLLIIYVFIISLFTEQIVFRKVFKDILQNKYFFIIFSSLVYAFCQIGYNISSTNDLFTLIPFAFAGIILSVSYEKSNNLITPCVVYLFYDLFILLNSI